MKSLLTKLSFCFSSGALGGAANALAVWVFGFLGLAAALGVNIAPELSPPFIYQKVVWGGIWGVLLLIPLSKKSLWLHGLLISLVPTLVQLFIIYPLKLHKGMMGLDLGSLTPLFVIFYNALWGVTAAFWYRLADGR